MRFLFTCAPLTGHLHSMVPYALALLERGHEVAVGTGARLEAAVRRSGLAYVRAGLDVESHEAIPGWSEIQRRFPSDPSLAQIHAFVEGLAPPMAADLDRIVERWNPRLIVRDPVELGGYLSAERAGIPHAAVAWGIYISVQHAARESLAALRVRQGLPPDPDLDSLDRFLVLSALPPSWPFPDCPVERVLRRYRLPPFDTSGGEALPAWVASLPDRPTVLVSLGTTFNREPETFRALLQALSRGDLNVVVTTGRSLDPADLGDLPGNARAERYIPQTLLLPRCDAIVFHAGFNSIHAALWHGLPMVLTPLGAGDQIWNAIRCAELGAGVVVEGRPPEPGAVRRAVRAVLDEPAFRARARALRAEMDALPGPSAAAEALERLARTREPQIAP